LHYDDTPLLVVNRMETDFLHKPGEVDRLILEIDALKKGTAQFSTGSDAK
jgi:hypothetical protein